MKSSIDADGETKKTLLEIRKLRSSVELLRKRGLEMIRKHARSTAVKLQKSLQRKNKHRVEKNKGSANDVEGQKYKKPSKRRRYKYHNLSRDEYILLNRERCRVNMRKHRAKMAQELTEEELQLRRAQRAKHVRELRAKKDEGLTEEQRKLIRATRAQKMKEHRAKLTEEQLKLRRATQAKQMKEHRAKLTEEQRRLRLERGAKYNRKREAKLRMEELSLLRQNNTEDVQTSLLRKREISSSGINFSCIETFPLTIINEDRDPILEESNGTQTGIFICIVCNEEYNKYYALRKHYTTHHLESEILVAKEKQVAKTTSNGDQRKGIDFVVKVYKCELCPEKCYTVPRYRKHIIQKHRTDNKDFVDKLCFVCSICDEAFSRQIHLTTHKRIVHDIFDQCPVCNENINTQELFTKHINEIHSDCRTADEDILKFGNVFFCKICGVRNLKRNDALKHFKIHEQDKSLKCDICDLQFKTRRLLVVHKTRIHKERSFCCEECGYQCITETSLRQHKRMHKPTKSKNERVECQKCKKTFSTRSYYRSHCLTVHENKRPFQCPVCGKTFTAASALYKHKITVCEKEKAVPKTCPICGKTLANYLLLFYHKANFHKYGNTEENVCHVCNKTIKSPLDLFSHNKHHHKTEEEKNNLKKSNTVNCAVCDKTFSSKTGLLDHWRVHREERPYSCSICKDQTFRYPYQFYAHRKKYHQSERDTTNIVIDTEMWKRFIEEFKEAHAAQFVNKANKEVNLESSEEATQLSNASNVPNNIFVSSHPDNSNRDSENAEDVKSSPTGLDSNRVNEKSFNSEVNGVSKSYVDFSRANNPVGLVDVKEDLPINECDEGNSKTEKTTEEDLEISSSLIVDDKFVESEDGFCETFMNSPMSVEYYESDSIVEDKPLICGSSNYHLDLLKMQLVVELERLKECLLCNEVFPSSDLHEEHMKSKGHRVAVRENKRKEILLEKQKRRDAKRKLASLKPKKVKEKLKSQKKSKKAKGKLKSEDNDNEEIFSCQFCNKKFSSISKHLMHIAKHKPRSANCLICSETFLTVRKLVDHYILEHDGDKVVKCKICDMGFLDCHPRNLREHMAAQHGEEKKIRKKERKYRCLYCKEKFSEWKLYSSHLLSHNNDEHKCEYCKEQFKCLLDLEGHYKETHTGELPFSCCECSKKFLTKVQLQTHEKNAHPKRNKEKSVFICDECGKSFSRQGDLVQHKTIHKTEEERNKFCCEFCGKSFFRAHSLTIHRREHTGERPYPCTLCESDVGFVSPALLKQHIDTVHKKNSHLCDVCGKSFDIRRNMLNHVRSAHSSAKIRFSCELCQEKFRTPEILKRHLDVHDPSRPFGCDHCSWRFKHSSNLKFHVKVVHEKGKM